MPSALQRALKETGLTLERDALPLKDRKVAVFAKLIAAIRKAESDINELDEQRNVKYENCRDENRVLSARNVQLEKRNTKLELAAELRNSSMDEATRARILNLGNSS